MSDVGAYKRCRRYWDWSSPTRTNLRHKVSVFGINVNLWFGTGIHYCLEQYYNPTLRRDPVETWNTWFTSQWQGGIIDESLLESNYDPNPRCATDSHMMGYTDTLYQVQGLRDLLPSPDEEEFAAFHLLGTGMMEFYRDYAKRNDNFEVIAAESTFSVPLGFEAIDQREDSPNYGKKLEVHARGKRDAIVHLLDIDKYGIIDHKTAGKMDEDYFLKLEKDPQCSTYMWASEKEALASDLPWTNIQYVLYNVLRKAYPKPPTPLKNGTPSLNRTEESTTAQFFQDYIVANSLELWFEDNAKAQGYYTWLMETGDENFIIREKVRRNAYELENTGEQLKMVAKEMLSDPLIYPNPVGSSMCTKCQFRAPCVAADDGSDWMGILSDEYEENRGR